MAELIAKERLQPALLDRLRDDHPARREETLQERVLTMRQLRRSVLKSLERLFNATNMEAGNDLSRHPRIAASVLNYGIPDLTGRTASGLTPRAIETIMRDAILRFEPRILPHTVRVRAVLSEERMDRNAIAFEIEGELWSQPVPMHLLLKTEVNLETGHVAVADSAGETRG
jgi:type VI secretion system protein ImpF